MMHFAGRGFNVRRGFAQNALFQVNELSGDLQTECRTHSVTSLLTEPQYGEHVRYYDGRGQIVVSTLRRVRTSFLPFLTSPNRALGEVPHSGCFSFK